MDLSNIKMVVTDLDGTYLKNDKTISNYTKEVIAKLRNSGCLFTVATARPVRAVKQFLPWVEFDAGIFHNGAVIFGKNHEVMRFSIDNPYDLICKIRKDKPEACIAVETNDILYANFHAERIWKGIEYISTDDFRELQGAKADKVIIEADSLEKVKEFEGYLTDDLYIELSENTVGMIMNRQASKMRAILLLAEKYGISPDEIVAFGDDHNDREMLIGCGKGIAVSNAHDVIRECADEICDSNEEDGVARWINNHLFD